MDLKSLKFNTRSLNYYLSPGTDIATAVTSSYSYAWTNVEPKSVTSLFTLRQHCGKFIGFVFALSAVKLVLLGVLLIAHAHDTAVFLPAKVNILDYCNATRLMTLVQFVYV